MRRFPRLRSAAGLKPLDGGFAGGVSGPGRDTRCRSRAGFFGAVCIPLARETSRADASVSRDFSAVPAGSLHAERADPAGQTRHPPLRSRARGTPGRSAGTAHHISHPGHPAAARFDRPFQKAAAFAADVAPAGFLRKNWRPARISGSARAVLRNLRTSESE